MRAYLSYDMIAVRKDLGDLVSFMIASGARIGEVCALSWADVDLDAGTVAIRGTVLRIKGKGLVISRPKTKAGERMLELPSWCIALLRDGELSTPLVSRSGERIRLTTPRQSRQPVLAGRSFFRPRWVPA